MMHTVKRVMSEGAIISTAGVLFALILYWIGPWANDIFASKWSGTCGGWDAKLTLAWVIGHVAHWYAYVTIGCVLLRLHPVLESVPATQITVYGMVAFIWGCGFTHLVAAYTAFDPLYRIEIFVLWVNGAVSIVSSVLVAYSLVAAFAEVRARRRAMELQLEEARRSRS